MKAILATALGIGFSLSAAASDLTEYAYPYDTLTAAGAIPAPSLALKEQTTFIRNWSSRDYFLITNRTVGYVAVASENQIVVVNSFFYVEAGTSLVYQTYLVDCMAAKTKLIFEGYGSNGLAVDSTYHPVDGTIVRWAANNAVTAIARSGCYVWRDWTRPPGS